MLAWLLSLFSFNATADEYTDHYDNMQGIVTGIVSDTVNIVSPSTADTVDTYAASQDGLEIGKQVAPAVQMGVSAGTTYLTVGQRLKRLEALFEEQKRVNNLVNDLQTSNALRAMKEMTQ